MEGFSGELAKLFVGITAGHLFLAIVGQMIHVSARLLKVVRSKKQFLWKLWVIENVLETAISFFSMIVLFVMLPKPLSLGMAFLIGYAADSLIKQFAAATKPK